MTRIPRYNLNPSTTTDTPTQRTSPVLYSTSSTYQPPTKQHLLYITALAVLAEPCQGIFQAVTINYKAYLSTPLAASKAQLPELACLLALLMVDLILVLY
jgi:hypothetical protein